jgi:hypothetical protein
LARRPERTLMKIFIDTAYIVAIEDASCAIPAGA